MPIGTARSCPSRKPANWRRTTARRACKSRRPRCPGSSGPWRIRTGASSNPTIWITSGRSKSACRTWEPWWASTRIGRRCTNAASCLPKTSTPRIRGSSRTSGWFELVTDGGHRKGGRTSRQYDAHVIVETLSHEALAQRRIHADVVLGHVEFVGSDHAIPTPGAVSLGIALDLHPRAEVDPRRIAPAKITLRIHNGHAFEAFA